MVFFGYFEHIIWVLFTSRYFTDCFLNLIRRFSSSPLMFFYVYLLIHFKSFVKYLFYFSNCLFTFFVYFFSLLSVSLFPILLTWDFQLSFEVSSDLYHRARTLGSWNPPTPPISKLRSSSSGLIRYTSFGRRWFFFFLFNVLSQSLLLHTDIRVYKSPTPTS